MSDSISIEVIFSEDIIQEILSYHSPFSSTIGKVSHSFREIMIKNQILYERERVKAIDETMCSILGNNFVFKNENGELEEKTVSLEKNTLIGLLSENTCIVGLSEGEINDHERNVCSILGNNFVFKNEHGELEEKTVSLEENTLIGLFFSRDNPLMDRRRILRFTHALKQKYDEWKELNVEIVFISADREYREWKEYFQYEHGDWLSLPWNDRHQIIYTRFGVSHFPMIPWLIFLDAASGNIIEFDGRKSVEQQNTNAIYLLLEKVKARKPSLLENAKKCKCKFIPTLEDALLEINSTGLWEDALLENIFLVYGKQLFIALTMSKNIVLIGADETATLSFESQDTDVFILATSSSVWLKNIRIEFNGGEGFGIHITEKSSLWMGQCKMFHDFKLGIKVDPYCSLTAVECSFMGGFTAVSLHFISETIEIVGCIFCDYRWPPPEYGNSCILIDGVNCMDARKKNDSNLIKWKFISNVFAHNAGYPFTFRHGGGDWNVKHDNLILFRWNALIGNSIVDDPNKLYCSHEEAPPWAYL